MNSIQTYLEEAKMGKSTIAIDFDRTIHSYHKGWHDGTAYGYLIEGSREAIIELHKRFRLVIFTARISAGKLGQTNPKQIQYVEEWLKKYDLDQYFSDITHIKTGDIVAIIDDRAVHFDGNWKTALKDFGKVKNIRG